MRRLAPDLELAPLAAPELGSLEQLHGRCELVRGADQPRRRRVGVLVSALLGDGTESEVLREELEDRPIVSSNLDDRAWREAAEPEAAFAGEKAAEVGEDLRRRAVEGSGSRLDITPYVPKTLGGASHLGLKVAVTPCLVRRRGPPIDGF
jgi:hypothetical protein